MTKPGEGLEVWRSRGERLLAERSAALAKAEERANAWREYAEAMEARDALDSSWRPPEGGYLLHAEKQRVAEDSVREKGKLARASLVDLGEIKP